MTTTKPAETASNVDDEFARSLRFVEHFIERRGRLGGDTMFEGVRVRDLLGRGDLARLGPDMPPAGTPDASPAG